MTPLEHLWNGWRADYVRGVERHEGDGSLFEAILLSGLSDDETHIVHRGEWVFALMNLFPYSIGHVMVLPYRVVAELDELDAEESAELWATVAHAVRLMKSVMGCGGVNVGLNLGRASGGSVPEHLHVHVVPRWVGDANFMTATANTRTLPESLPVTAARLRVAWSAS